jgi:phospholipase C
MKRLWTCALLSLALSAPNAEAGRSRECPYEAGALPADTLRPGMPHGDQIPIDHIIVLMQENRSFDHMLGNLFREGQPNSFGLKASFYGNPDPTGTGLIESFHTTRLCEVADLSHSWNGTHRQLGPAEFMGFRLNFMDGFTLTNAVSADPTGSRTMGHFTSADIPFYFGLYATFAMADRYFASVPGPTYPNRFFLIAGTSFGRIRNEFPQKATEYGPSIYDRLNDAGVAWKAYYSDLPFAGFFAGARAHVDQIVPIDQFYEDAANGTLPQVAYVDPKFGGGPAEQTDEHPPGNIQLGQAFVEGIVQALFASPDWPRTALFIEYDEHGGYFDHVVPPAACVPDATPPRLQPGDTKATFDQYGVRVPMVVVSPWARPHYVSHVVHDHTSILRFIETRFDLPALTARDANTDPPLEMFDFSAPAFATPPTLPAAEVDPDRAAECTEGG